MRVWKSAGILSAMIPVQGSDSEATLNRTGFMRCNIGVTIGTVSMVLATAISSRAVKVSLVMICLSSRMLAKMIMISALVCSSQPMMRGLARLPFEDFAGEMHADQLAGDRGDQQQRRGDEHRLAAHGPVGAQAGAEEEHRHDDQQHVVAQQVHLLLVEPLAIHDGAGEEGADHEVQAGPVGAEAADGEPDQRHVPAVAFRQPLHQLAEDVADNGEGEQETDLPADALPVHQDQRQHAPDGDVVQAGVAQDALADRLAQDLQLLHEQDQDGQRGDRAGHADAEHELPGLAPCGPIQPA